MRKTFAIYWIIGCIFSGVGMAHHERICPNTSVSAKSVVYVTVLWPAISIAALFLPKDFKAPCRQYPENVK